MDLGAGQLGLPWRRRDPSLSLPSGSIHEPYAPQLAGFGLRPGKLTTVTAPGTHQDDSAERVVSHAIDVGRILWGATTAIASRQVHNAVGISYPSSDLGVWIKAFGVRDIVLGAAALHPDSAVRRANLRAGIAMDLIGAMLILYFTYWLGRSEDFEIAMFLFLATTIVALPLGLKVAQRHDKATLFLVGTSIWMVMQAIMVLATPEWPRWSDFKRSPTCSPGSSSSPPGVHCARPARMTGTASWSG